MRSLGPRTGGPRPSWLAARHPASPVPVIASAVTHSAAHDDASLSLTSRTDRGGYVIAALSGELGIASAPALREQLLSLLRAASHLIIDLSSVEDADASGLAVLVGSERRARLLGGSLRLAAPSPEVARVLSATGMNQHLDIYPTVRAAMGDVIQAGSEHERHRHRAGSQQPEEVLSRQARGERPAVRGPVGARRAGAAAAQRARCGSGGDELQDVLTPHVTLHPQLNADDAISPQMVGLGLHPGHGQFPGLDMA